MGGSSKTSSLAPTTGGSFTLIVLVGSWQREFRVGTFCKANPKILPSYAIWQKISMPYKLSGKTKFSMASCVIHNWEISFLPPSIYKTKFVRAIKDSISNCTWLWTDKCVSEVPHVSPDDCFGWWLWWRLLSCLGVGGRYIPIRAEVLGLCQEGQRSRGG